MNDNARDDIDIRPERLPPTPNLFPFTEIAELPPRVCLSGDEFRTASTVLGDEIKEILSHMNTSKFPEEWTHFQRGIYLIGCVLKDINRQPAANVVAAELLKRYPNLCWMRGGNLTEKNGIAVLDGWLVNGYVGDARALSVATKGYAGARRSHPVLLVAPLTDIVSAAQILLDVETEHYYDLTLGQKGNNPMYFNWCRNSLKVFEVGNTEEQLKQAKDSLDSKAIAA